jgi:carboxypeptidase Taq
MFTIDKKEETNMPRTLEELVAAYQLHQEKNKALDYVTNVASFDAQTIAPKNTEAVNERAAAMGYFALESFKHNTSSEFDQLIQELSAQQEKLSISMQRIVYLERKSLDKLKKIDPKDYQEFAILLSQAQVIWEKARANNDFQSYAPYLERILTYVRKFATLTKVVEGPLYNHLLDEYEEGNTIEKLDAFFATLKNRIVPLLKKIQQSNVVIRNDFMSRIFPKHQQLAYAKSLLGFIGYDLSRGALAESVHPFSSEISPNDVRVTTRIYEDNFISNIYSTAHEAGHGIYEQFIGDDLKGTLIGHGAAMSIHESQSRFYENILGRSYEFTQLVFPELKKQFKEQFEDVTIDEFYNAINEAKASLIRTESDELTYSLHIMIRYELEKRLIDGSLAVKDLPTAWNELYQSYLGLTPENDALGCLQDVHWSGGAFGYFPSYALGNAISVQLLKTMEKDVDLKTVIQEKKLTIIRDWFADKVYRYGKLYPPFELLKKVTGEDLNPLYYCDYLEKKFSKIYQIK